MGIYIKGMEMPKDCIKDPFCRFEDGYWKCLVDGSHADFGGSCRPFKCPLIEVSPHGRLIDADALINHLEFTMKHCTIEGHTAQRYREMIVELSIAPTVIPAEEGE